MATPTWRRPGTMSYCVASRSPTRGFVSRSHPRPRGSSFVARRGGSVARGVLVTAEFSGPRPQDPDIGASAGWIVLSSFLTPRSMEVSFYCYHVTQNKGMEISLY